MDSKIQQLIDDVKNYASTRYDILRLELLEKLSLIIGLLILILICVFLVLIAFAYFTISLAMWLSNFISLAGAFCIIGAVFLVVTGVIVAMRERILINPLVKVLSGILFAEQPAQATADTHQQQPSTTAVATTSGGQATTSNEEVEP